MYGEKLSDTGGDCESIVSREARQAAVAMGSAGVNQASCDTPSRRGALPNRYELERRLDRVESEAMRIRAVLANWNEHTDAAVSVVANLQQLGYLR